MLSKRLGDPIGTALVLDSVERELSYWQQKLVSATIPQFRFRGNLESF